MPGAVAQLVEGLPNMHQALVLSSALHKTGHDGPGLQSRHSGGGGKVILCYTMSSESAWIT